MNDEDYGIQITATNEMEEGTSLRSVLLKGNFYYQ